MRYRFLLFVFMLLAVVPGQTRLPPASRQGSTAFAQGEAEVRQGDVKPAQRLIVQGPPTPREPAPVDTANAVALALMDAEKMSASDRSFMRYLYVPDGQFKNANIALNVVSRGNVPIRAVPLAGGLLLRVDMRHYARSFLDRHYKTNPDIESWLGTWEELRYDPTFNLLVTQDNVRFSKGQLPKQTRKVKKIVKKKERKIVPCEVYRAEDGLLHDSKYEDVEVDVEVEVDEDVDFLVLRLDPDYLPGLPKLQALLHSQAPIVLDRYFMARALQTVKTDPLERKDTAWSVIWGGLYYEFRGIKRSKDKNVTDEDLFLQQFGIDNAEKLFNRLQTDQRSAIFRSGITGRPRRIDFFNTPAGKAWDVMGVGSITHDLRMEDVDVGTHPLMNLLKFKDQAREDIFVGANGMHVYAIFNGEGKLLDEAAINVVSDRTVPSPHPPRLQCALSCMACHEADGSDGWKAVGNDVKKLLSNRVDPLTGRQQLDLDVMTDLNFKDQIGIINRIAGLYAGDFSRGMRRSRDDYAETILRVSGPQGNDQTQIVKTSMSSLVNSTRSFIYDEITPRQACWELGIDTNSQDPVDLLRSHLPPEPAKVGFAPEDPRLAALKKNIPIPRTDWAFVQSYAASRVAKHKDRNKK